MALGNGDEAASRPTPTRWADSDEKQVVLGPESAPEVYVQPGLIPASHNYSIADTKVPLSGISSAGADGSVFNGDTPISKQDQSGSKGQHLEAGAPPKKSSKKKWIWIGAVAAACVVVGAVVGGVVGSRATSGGTISPSASSPTTPASPAATAFAVRKNSRLAVTGWKSEQSDNIRLFYQDTEGRVRYSTLSSTDRGGWSRPTVLGVDAEPGTPLAACSFVARTPVHIELYYVDNSSTLRGQFFENSNTSPAGGSSSASINNFPMRLRNARMSCYVPYLIVQEEDDTVRALLWEEARVGARDPSKAWANQTLTSVRGSGGSGTAVVPITPQFLDSSAFLYRRSDGTLANFDVSTDGNVTGTSWAANRLGTFLSPNTSIAGFTVARTAAMQNTDVNTYILYQDDSGAIQAMWQDFGPWMGPKTFPALNLADKGTDIACVTKAVWNSVGISLGPLSDLNRCYFQSGGRIKEVRYDGTTWQDLGYVPFT